MLRSRSKIYGIIGDEKTNVIEHINAHAMVLLFGDDRVD